MKYKKGEQITFNNLQNSLISYIKKNSPESLSTTRSILSELSRTYDLSTRNATYYCNSGDENKEDPKSATFVFKTGAKTIVIGLNGVVQYSDDNIYKYADRADAHFVNNAKISFFNGTTLDKCSLHGESDKNVSQWQNNFGDISTIFVEPAIPENIAGTLNRQHATPNAPFACSKQGLKGEHKYNISFKNGNKVPLIADKELEGDISLLKTDNEKYTSDSKVFYTGIISNFDKYEKGIIKDDYGNNIFVESDKNGDFIGYTDENRRMQSSITIGAVKNKLAKILLRDNNSISSNDLNSKTSLLEHLLYAAFSRTYGKNISPHNYINARYTDTNGSFFLQVQQCNIHGSSKSVFVSCNSNGEWCIAVKDDNKPQNDGYEVYFSNGTIFTGSCIQQGDSLQFCNGTFCKSGKFLNSNARQNMSDVFNINFETEGRDITDEVVQKFNETDFVSLKESNDKYENVVYGHMFENSIVNGIFENTEPNEEYKNRIIENVFSQLSAGLYDLLREESDLKEHIENIRQKMISDEAVEVLKRALNKLNNDAKINGYITIRGKKITSYDIGQEIERLLYAKYLYDKFLSEEKNIEEEEEEEELPDEEEPEKKENNDIKDELERLKKEKEELIKKVDKNEKENEEKKDAAKRKDEKEEEEEEEEELPDEEYINRLIPNVETLSGLISFREKAKDMYMKKLTGDRNPDKDKDFGTLLVGLDEVIVGTMLAKYKLIQSTIKAITDELSKEKVKKDDKGRYYIDETDFKNFSNFLQEKILKGVVRDYNDDIKNASIELENMLKANFVKSGKEKNTARIEHKFFEEMTNKNKEIEDTNRKGIQGVLEYSYKQCKIFYPQNEKDLEDIEENRKKALKKLEIEYGKKDINNKEANTKLPDASKTNAKENTNNK